MKKIRLNLADRFTYTLIAFTIFILAGVAVFAFGTSNPSNFGHSAKELDLSTGVDGNVVFNGNLDISGESIFGGWLKVGTSTTCDVNAEGMLRYNSADKKMEFCNSSSWSEIGSPPVTSIYYPGGTSEYTSSWNVLTTPTFTFTGDSNNMFTIKKGPDDTHMFWTDTGDPPGAFVTLTLYRDGTSYWSNTMCSSGGRTCSFTDEFYDISADVSGTHDWYFTISGSKHTAINYYLWIH